MMPDLPSKVMQTHIESLVKDTSYTYDGVLTICVITLLNGTKLTGESACVSEANYNKALGEQYARLQAINKIWPLEGYLLKQRLFENQRGTP